MVEWDYPQHEAVVRHVLATRPDLLVAETAHHSRIARWILSNTDWELIRSCPCPLWLVRGGRLPKKPQLLVAVDPGHEQAGHSRLDARLLEAARRLVDNIGGTIGIVHADDPQASQIDAVERLGKRHGVAPARRYVIPGDTTRVLPAVVGDRPAPTSCCSAPCPAAACGQPLHRHDRRAADRPGRVRRVRRQARRLPVAGLAPAAA